MELIPMPDWSYRGPPCTGRRILEVARARARCTGSTPMALVLLTSIALLAEATELVRKVWLYQPTTPFMGLRAAAAVRPLARYLPSTPMALVLLTSIALLAASVELVRLVWFFPARPCMGLP